MTKTFNLDTTVGSPSLMARAKKTANENGAALVGDERSGRFSNEVVGGEYRMVGRTVIVTITDKHSAASGPVGS